MKRGLFVGLVVSGCWSAPDLVDGAFTQDQWAHLEAELTVHRPDPCVGTRDADQCNQLARLGQELFFEPALSANGLVSCATCHDPGTVGEKETVQGWFVDTRDDNHVSATSATARGWTKRNTPSVVNVGLKAMLAPGQSVFTWSGEHSSSGAVLKLALDKAMGRAVPNSVAQVIRDNPRYFALFVALFDSVGSNEVVFEQLALVFDTYMRRLDSSDSSFDRYLAGETSALTAREKHGFAVFVGPGMCIECHRGPLFSDFKFHNTGVPQTGANVELTDLGRFNHSTFEADRGAFLTGSLRNIAGTGPYMHDGALATLDDVIWFYRTGGGVSGFDGVKDPRMVPIDITDDEAHDLEAFLRTLTGSIDPSLLVDPRPPPPPPDTSCTVPGNGNPGKVCDGVCRDIANDLENCGDCGNVCMPGGVCMHGCYHP